MCLELSCHYSGCEETAEADLVVYKHLIDNCDGHNIFYPQSLLTSYRKQPVEIGRTYESEFSYGCDGRSVEKALHCFISPEDAEADAFSYMRIAKCLIPKGSTYYRGRFFYYECLASDQLIYLELIK